MAIYAPQPLLTPTDKELLVLLAKVVLEENRHSYDGNAGADRLLIGDEDAAALCDLLTEYANGHAFIRGATFAEMVSDGRLSDDSKAREIYLKSRSERGRTRVLSSRQGRISGLDWVCPFRHIQLTLFALSQSSSLKWKSVYFALCVFILRSRN